MDQVSSQGQQECVFPRTCRAKKQCHSGEKQMEKQVRCIGSKGPIANYGFVLQWEINQYNTIRVGTSQASTNMLENVYMLFCTWKYMKIVQHTL